MRTPDDQGKPPFSLKAALAAQAHAAREALRGNDAPHAVHEARIALKRARALARVAEHVKPGAGAEINRTAAAAMDMLAQARERTALETAARGAHLDGVAAALRAGHGGDNAVALARAQAALETLELRVAEFEDTPAKAVRAAAKRLDRRAGKSCKRARGTTDAKRRHVWRKREKDRQNAELLLDGAWPKSVPRRARLSRKLTDALGDERDAALLIKRLQADPALAGGAKSAKRAIRDLKTRRADFAKQADKLGKKLHMR